MQVLNGTAESSLWQVAGSALWKSVRISWNILEKPLADALKFVIVWGVLPVNAKFDKDVSQYCEQLFSRAWDLAVSYFGYESDVAWIFSILNNAVKGGNFIKFAVVGLIVVYGIKAVRLFVSWLFDQLVQAYRSASVSRRTVR